MAKNGPFADWQLLLMTGNKPTSTFFSGTGLVEREQAGKDFVVIQPAGTPSLAQP